MNRFGDFLFESGKDRLSFSQPVEVVEARHASDVLSALQHVRSEIARGRFAAGYLSYEAAPAFDAAFVCHRPDDMPLLWFGIYERTSNDFTEASTNGFEFGPWAAAVCEADYLLALKSIRKWIAAGETYQVNYTYPLTAAYVGDPRACYARLKRAQGEGHTAYLDIGRYQIVSASPELFFRLDGDRVTSRPMKGTAQRGLWTAHDEAIARALQTSPKDQAENVMIVDMIRNDLGRVCDVGSVRVERLFDVERYPTVWQMTSTVSGLTKADVPEIFAALFPCASVTGAPKIQTMRRIHELEPGPRGVYCGAIGWWGPDRSAEFSVAIRTATLDSETGRARYHVGSGVTWDSSAQGEYDECGSKALVLHYAPPRFQLLESLLWDGRYFLLDEHLARMSDSARYFGYVFDASEARRALEDAARMWTGGSKKVRLLVSPDGTAAIEHASAPTSRRISACLAAHPVDSGDRFLYHKTTNRAVYGRAISEAPCLDKRALVCDDVILWNEYGEITESTTANVVVRLDGQMVTPPVSCGLLPGLMRAKLIAEGVIVESPVSVNDLPRAEGIWLINSVRKWIDVDYIAVEQRHTFKSRPSDAP